MKKALSVEIEAKRFYAYLPKLQKALNLNIEETVREGARLFTRSAARHTPPLAGRRLARYAKSATGKTDLFNRVIVPKVFTVHGHKYLAADRARKYLSKAGTGLAAKYKRDGKLDVEFLVMRKIPTTRRFKRELYRNYAEAKAAARITTRGLLRAGWWGTLLRIGGSVEERYGEKVGALVQTVSKTAESRDPDRYGITIINAVNEAGAGSAAGRAVAFGMGAATNQMRAMAKKAADSLPRLPF